MKSAVCALTLVAVLMQATATGQPFQNVDGPIDGNLIRETPHFRIYAENGTFPVAADWFQTEAETIYGYVTARMGVSANEKFAVTIRPPDTRVCPIRGLANSDRAVAEAIVYADAQTSQERIRGVLAHEVAHLLHNRALKAGSGGGRYVTEGLATWAAGKYWEAWQKVTPTEMVRSYQREKRYIPLADHYKEDLKTPNNTSDCLAQRDLAYASWASFLDFLINKYGMEKLRQLLGPLETEVTGQFGQTGRLIRIPDGPNFDPKLAELFGFVTVDATQIDVVQGLYQPDPDFQKAYGITLTELEKTWLEQLKP